MPQCATHSPARTAAATWLASAKVALRARPAGASGRRAKTALRSMRFACSNSVRVPTADLSAIRSTAQVAATRWADANEAQPTRSAVKTEASASIAPASATPASTASVLRSMVARFVLRAVPDAAICRATVGLVSPIRDAARRAPRARIAPRWSRHRRAMAIFHSVRARASRCNARRLTRAARPPSRCRHRYDSTRARPATFKAPRRPARGERTPRIATRFSATSPTRTALAMTACKPSTTTSSNKRAFEVASCRTSTPRATTTAHASSTASRRAALRAWTGRRQSCAMPRCRPARA